MTASLLLAPTAAAVAVAVALGVFGLAIGSFLNVVAYRVPLGMSVARPPSACPTCGRQIRAADNIPVLSYLLLGGKCRGCRSRISLRYPLVEAGTGAFFAVVALAFSAPLLGSTDARSTIGGLLALAAYLYLAAISVTLALIDIDTHRLPNAIVLPSYAVGLVLLAASALVGGDPGRLGTALLGMAIAAVAYGLLWFVYPAGMGLGDVKLAGVLGLFLGFLGWGPLVVGLFAPFLLGGIFAIGLVVLRRAGRKSGIPFGPWMLAGAWVGVFAGTALWNGYLSFVGLAG